MPDAFVECNLTGLPQRVYGRGRNILHPILGEEAADFVAERFQVNIGCVEIGQQVGKRLLAYIARSDENVPQSMLMRQAGGIDDIFDIGERLGGDLLS